MFLLEVLEVESLYLEIIVFSVFTISHQDLLHTFHILKCIIYELIQRATCAKQKNSVSTYLVA